MEERRPFHKEHEEGGVVTKPKRSQTGETIVESLVSMLIISLIFVFLVNAIVTSARVNSRVSTEDSSFDLATAVTDDVKVTIASEEVDCTLYKMGDDDDGVTYYYYQ